MNKISRGLAVAVTAAASVVALSGAAQARPAAGDWNGCPYGAVCIWGQDRNPYLDPHPTNVYWSYGAHNLSNQYGDHYVFNNQYGGASMSLCTGYNGVGCHLALAEQEIGSFNLTPYNSVTLNR
ncbi:MULTISPECIES: hypothetical protein [Streptomyces]|uniref:Peptidase inhibitor family I36 n=1 Tax=Streptomyces canarius TaxID=285453 RepID=A0ABQ3D9U2_9ACTN|nr:hypothetical protein [Streptomyces canarius]GHA65428.1 hypothetical protein GCM10010345_81760 [Streptomyces canarius]